MQFPLWASLRLLESASCTFLLWILSFGEAKESISPAAKRFKVRNLAVNNCHNYSSEVTPMPAQPH
jgi:hypothetical protein